MADPKHILERYLSPGQIISQRYQLEHVLGSGAYGAIYMAHDLVSHERVAIKALPPREENASRTAFERFKREMQIVGSLSHASIITLYDFGETPQGVPFMVMEYVEGRTLDVVTHARPMSVEDGLEVLSQILGALAAAHDSGIIHRDLKPANIMVTGEPGRYKCKVLDFGMAKILESLGEETITQLTREGVAVGTPRYIAPEQARGLTVGAYTDVYAAGLLAYEIFTGARAVKDHTIEGAVMAHVSPTPLALPEMASLPEPIQRVIRQMTAKAIPERYPHARQALRDVERLASYLRRRANGLPEHVGALDARAQAPQVLEIDYERVEEFEQAHRARVGEFSTHKGAGPLASESSPAPHPLRHVERLIALPCCLAGFMVLSTIIPVQGGLRVIASMMPMVVGGLFGWVLRRKGPFTPSRMLWLSGLSCFIAPHLLNIQRVTAELFVAPTWFLEPFEGIPGVGWVEGVLKGAAQGWATLLSGFF